MCRWIFTAYGVLAALVIAYLLRIARGFLEASRHPNEEDNELENRQ